MLNRRQCCGILWGIALVPSCSKSPSGNDATSASGPLMVDQISVRRIEDHLRLSVSVNLKNETAESVTLNSSQLTLEAAGQSVPEYVVPFTESVTIAPDQTGKGTLHYWLDQPMANQALQLKWRQDSLALKQATSFSIADLPPGEDRIVNW